MHTTESAGGNLRVHTALRVCGRRLTLEESPKKGRRFNCDRISPRTDPPKASANLRMILGLYRLPAAGNATSDETAMVHEQMGEAWK